MSNERLRRGEEGEHAPLMYAQQVKSERGYPPPGIVATFKNTRLTKFDCWKLLKTKKFKKCGKFEAIRKLLKIRAEGFLATLGINHPRRIFRFEATRKLLKIGFAWTSFGMSQLLGKPLVEGKRMRGPQTGPARLESRVHDL